MARPSEYNYEFLKQYKGVNVIYGLYIDESVIKYVGYSKNIHERFRNHLRNNPSDSNTKKYNFVEKYKAEIKIKILSVNPKDWEIEEKRLILVYKDNDLLNICSGGKNNRIKKRFEDNTTEEHLLEINKSLKELNTYYKSKGKQKRFELLTSEEIKKLI